VKYLLPTLGTCAAALLLGYLWPLPNPPTETTDQQAWVWPSAPQPAAATAAPSKLSTYWPGTDASNEADNSATDQSQKSTVTHTWRLIGIIRQGKSLSALVQDPKQNIVTLKPGDHLGEARRVSRLEPTRLHWQDNDGRTGALLLYPDPTPE
jgi:hypothetical protein